MSPIRIRVSPGTVIASIALLVALGGTSIAAVQATVPNNSVGAAQLKTNAVTNPKIAANAVSTVKIAASAVTAGRIAANAVTNAKIANSAVTNAKLSANAVTSSKVQNGTLLSADFAPGQIPAGPAGPAGAAGPAGPAGVAPPPYVAGVTSATSPNVSTTSSTSFTNLPGATVTVNVPTGQTAQLDLRFTAESACYGGGAGGWCSVIILVDGSEANPVAGTNFAFDSTNNGADGSNSWESHAMERLSNTLSAGSHTVTVQYAVVAPASTLWLDDWALTVDSVRLS